MQPWAGKHKVALQRGKKKNVWTLESRDNQDSELYGKIVVLGMV